MFSFVRSPKARARRAGSHLALALALVSAGGIGAVALEAPAHAQKKKNEEEAPKANYSKGFVEVYQPLAARIQAKEDPAALKAALPAMTAAAETDDDKFVAGQATYSVGLAAKDLPLQRQGIEMMLDSGKVPAEQQGLNLFAAGQLAFQAEDWAAARSRFEQAIAAGYDDPNAQGLLAESYFSEENYAAGLASLKQAIDAQAAAGAPIDESWIQRGFAVSYNNQLADQAAEFAELYVTHYPSSDIWGDAIAVQRSFYDYDDNAILDILRLADRTDSLRTERDYIDYISAADARRLPGEVGRIVNKGLAANLLKADDVLVAEAKTTSEAQSGPAREDLPELERDARASASGALAASAAGDMYLNFGNAAKAAEMYELALTKSDVDTARVLTRLGIAQVDLGQFAEAKATFGRIQGPRAPIANLWSIYADAQASGGTTATTTAAADTPAQ